MIFYFIFLFLIAVLCGRYNVVSNKHIIDKENGYNFAIIFIILVTSLRFNIGYDWSEYLKFVYPAYYPKNTLRLEPFNRLIMFICGTIGSPLLFFSFYAFITILLFGKTVKKYSFDKYTSLIIYLSLFYLQGLSLIRQEIAVMITFFGYKYLKEDKPFKFLLISILAACFHKSALVTLIFYPIYKAKRRDIVIIIVTCVVGVKIILPAILARIFPIFLFYLEKGGIMDSSGNFQRLVYFVLIVYCILLQNRQTDKGLLHLCMLGALLPFLLGGHTGGRLAEYFLIYYVLLIPQCNKKFTISYKIIFLIPFYIFFFIYLYVSVYINFSDEYVPFRWYFLEDLNQQLR